MPILSSLFANREEKQLKVRADQVFVSLIEHIRQPWFYLDLKVEDSPAGRYELICVHLYAVLQVLKTNGNADQIEKNSAAPASEKFAQLLTERFFDELDMTFREMGVGDMGVGRKVRTLASQFYERAATYDDALDKTRVQGNMEPMAAALIGTVYQSKDDMSAEAEIFSAYFAALLVQVRQHGQTSLMDGNAHFPDHPASGKKHSGAT